MDVGEYIRNKQKKGQGTQQKPKNAEEALKMYTQMSEEQLMQELFRVSREGEYSEERLMGFYNKVQMFLTPEQRAKMKDLIVQLRK